MWCIGGFIVAAAVITMSFALYATAKAVEEIKRLGPGKREKVLQGEHAYMAMKCLIADSCLKMVIAGIMCYALVRIAFVARNNQQRVRDVCWSSLFYLLILLLQVFLSICVIITSAAVLNEASDANL